MNAATDNITVLILAAGASKRLGQPKALLTDAEGSTLIQRAVNTAVASGATEIYVVVGAEDESVRAALDGTPVKIVSNPEWEEGMASSIRAGITEIKQSGSADGVLILLVDQPELTADILKSMIGAFGDASRLVACRYGGVIGVPALIGAEHLDDLLSLTGEQGARYWLRTSADDVAVVAFPGGAHDVDTVDDANDLNLHLDS